MIKKTNIEILLKALEKHREKSIFYKNQNLLETTIGLYQYDLLEKWYTTYKKEKKIELSLQKLLQKEEIHCIETLETIYNLNSQKDIELYLPK
ncbi:MAG: hypothetical protein ACK4UJ_04360 [Leptonema sp. (in: bacteria)]